MNLHKKVDQLLANKPVLRDSDKKLLLSVWHLEGLHLTDQQRDIFLERCSTAESITRERRKLKVKYPASKEITEERFQKMKQYQDQYREEDDIKAYYKRLGF